MMLDQTLLLSFVANAITILWEWAMSFRRVFGVAVVISIFAAGSPAAAASIFGTLSINGSDVIDYAAHTITFAPGSSRVGAASGSFLTDGFAINNLATMRNEGTAVSYPSPALDLGSNLSCGAGCI